MAGIKNVSRVRVEAQERLDLPDFNAIADLHDEGAQSAIGGLMGRGGGLLSPMQFTLVNDGVTFWLKPGAFTYYWSKRDGTAPDGTYRSWKGGVNTYNPTAEGQSQLVDCTTIPLLIPSYLYVRPKAVNTATDARRKWSAGAEASVSLKTRTSIVHEFKNSTEGPDAIANDGWAPILHYNTLDVASSSLIMVWDSLDAMKVAEQGTQQLTDGKTSVRNMASWLNSGTDGSASSVEDFNGGATTDRSMGLIQMLMQLRTRLYRHLDKAGSRHWDRDPVRDFKQLDDSLLATDAAMASLDARVVPLEGVKRFSWFIESQGVTYVPISFQTGAPDTTGNVPVLNRVALGVVDLKFPGGAGLALQGIFVQPASRLIGPAVADWVVMAVSPTPGWEYRLGLNLSGASTDSSFFLSMDYRVP